MPNRTSKFPALTPRLVSRIVKKTAETVRDRYIFPDDAKAMSDLLLAKLREGTFDDLKAVPDLTQAMTEALHSVRADLHLVAMAWLPQAAGGEADGVMDSWHRRMARHNYEFRRLEVLLGNVGYVDLRGFASAEMGGPTASAAMGFLAHADALIFDLRDNGGGEDLVYYLMSYLFDKPTHVHTARYRDHDEQNWTYGYVPGPRFADKPAYVVISRTTFSAGEDFSYNLQQLGRVTVVGEQTRGGAHPVEFYRFPELYLELMIPNACSENPVSRANWEETGVTPDIAAPADEALDVAHRKALERLAAEDADDETRRSREWALETLRLRAKHYMPEPGALAACVGSYGSSVEVAMRGDDLTMSWGGRRAYVLAPLARNRFEFDHGTQQVTFGMQKGTAKSLVWRTEDGDEWRMTRKV
ncbi:MAG: S41 family peptidase [Candidatus Bipolaricaulis sp.]|nr:S41 family peptidase [Candidatus Bipolaricaulis sp.]